MKLFLSVLFIIVANCHCILTDFKKNTINIQKAIIPIESFIKIEKKMEISVCFAEKSCFSTNAATMGSGAIVEKFQTGFLVLTANHVCEEDASSILPDSLKLYATVKTKLLIKDFDNNKMDAIVYKKDKMNDICLLYVGKQTKFPKIKMSNNAPERGDRVFNMAAPGGIYDYRMVPIFEGFYSGRSKIKKNLVDV